MPGETGEAVVHTVREALNGSVAWWHVACGVLLPGSTVGSMAHRVPPYRIAWLPTVRMPLDPSIAVNCTRLQHPLL